MRVRILPPSSENLEILAQALQKGEVVGMPTETVYGLAGDCFNPIALARIFETKERPTFDPLIIHVGPTAQGLPPGLEELQSLGLIHLSHLEPQSRLLIDRLIQAFWPGPLTFILPKSQQVPDLATSGLPTVAVRMPAHPLAQALITAAQRPLAAPSANRFGRISPTTSEAVREELGDRMDWILEGGTCDIGLESTILSVNPSNSRDIRILRAGGTSKEEIEKVVGFPILSPSAQTTTFIESGAHHPEAPGMLESHYAPRKPFLLLEQPLSKLSDLELSRLFKDFVPNALKELRGQLVPLPQIGLLLISGAPEAAQSRISAFTDLPILVRSLSPKNDLREAAHNLFAEMRELDASPASLLLVEPCQIQEGLGYAIADRLKRASAGSRNSKE